MTHEAFRLIIPGLCFWLPVFAVRLVALEDYASFAILAGAIAAAVPPTGWVLYGGFRVFRRIIGKTYETKRFVEMFRERLRAVYAPGSQAVFLDFRSIRPDLGRWKLDIATYLDTFCPFRGRTSATSVDPGWVTRIPFLEHLLDLTLFKEKSYDYARSISSVRYGLSSALYSLVLGSIAAAGQYLVLRSASSPYGQTLTIAGWAVVGGVAALLFYALYRRRLDSSAEYDARLNLIVLSSLELARIEEGEPEVSELQVNITELAAAAENPVAVFDLDNTLLIGDVQEALLARLSRAGRLRGFRWSEYVGMLETDHQRALRMAVEALDGHTLSSIEQETRALLVENESKLVVQGCEILMPKPHPVLQRLVAQLQMSGIECLVISASNQISVEVLSLGVVRHSQAQRRGYSVNDRASASEEVSF